MKTYKKSIIREILSSKARFFSIMVIIFLGVSFYSGIKSAGPDMNKTINSFYNDKKLMDSKVVSTLGLTDKDLELLKDNDKILDYTGTHTIDANLTNMSNIVRFMEYDKKNNINDFTILEGRLPENTGEISLDEKAFKLNKNLKIGDEFTIESDEDTMKNFKGNKFKIVGKVSSPMYIEQEGRGATPVGKGTIDYFGVLNSDDIKIEPYSDIYIRFNNVQGLNAYGLEYENLMEENNKYLEELYKNRSNEREEEVKADIKREFDSAYKDLDKNQKLLLEKEADLKEGRAEFNKGKAKYAEKKKDFEEGIKAGEAKFLEGENKLKVGKNELNKQKEELSKGEKELNKAKESLENTRRGFLNSGIDPDKNIDDIDQNLLSIPGVLEGIKSYQKGKVEYEKQLGIINNGKSKILEAEDRINKSSLELEKGKNTLEEGKVKGKKELLKAKEELEKSEKKLNEGEKAIKENKDKLADGIKEVQDKEKLALDKVRECKYIIFDRRDNQGYSGYKDSINSLDSIASVLPVFFFIVAILICLTTMTRMVEEKRIEIGTMKALGYDDFRISLKFVIYASLASILGCFFGILVGSNIIPNIISNAYTSVYELPRLEMHYYTSYIIQSLGISILCTVGAALFVIRVELKSKPSNLMRSKAPKVGKKILLERASLIWNRLNFNQKVTCRNIFRYKQRMIMTIFGISGGMALIITGFGLKDSNNGMVEKQFDKIWKYEAMVIFGDNQTTEDIKKYEDKLKNLKGYESNLEMHQQSVTFDKDGMNKQTVSLYVPKNVDDLDNFVVLNDRVSDEKYKVLEEGAIINEKLANLLGVSVGDTITFKDENNNSYDVKVSNISENYIMHSMYIAPSYYEKIFKEKPVYNMDFVNFNRENFDEEKVSSELIDCDNVINVQMTSQIEKTTKESAANMNVVMIVIILSAGSLAFVVLYNLNNINVSERIRELSTIKVLGCYDEEVTMYILRENIILTLLGVISGGVLGKALHAFIINTSETDTMMMYPNISFSSYIIAGLITIFFSVIVMVLMHIKLKKVNMIDALKSNE